jgi:hypothetical protein
MMQPGSKEAIAYEFFHFVDEVLHALGWLDAIDIRVRFCRWAHRYDDDHRDNLQWKKVIVMVKRAKESGQWGRMPPLGSMI